LVSSRTDFSTEQINGIADQLEGAWKQVLGQQGARSPGTIAQLLKSASPEELQSDQLGEQIQLIKAGQDAGKQSTGLMNQAMQQGLNVLLGSTLQRVDLSDLDVEKISGLCKLADKAPDLDVEKISGSLQKLKDKATEQVNKVGSQVADKAQRSPLAPSRCR